MTEPTTTHVALCDTERALASVILSEPRALIPLWGVLKPEDINDLLAAQVYQACLDLMQARMVPNPYTVNAHAPELPLDTLLALQQGVNPQLVNDVLALAAIVRQEAVYRRLAATTESLAKYAKARPRDVDAYVNNGIRELSQITAGRVDRPSNLDAILTQVDAEVTNPQIINGIPTGFNWLTERLTGFQPGDIVVLVAPYKGRKTSAARNMFLAAAKAGHHVAWYALEGNQRRLTRDLWAMLATEWLWRNVDPVDFRREATLDGLHLNVALRSPLQHEALQRSRVLLDSIAEYIHIADGRDGIINLNAFNARVNRDHFLYHTEMIVIDHLQLFHAGSTEIYKNVSQASACIQEFSTGEGVVSLTLSQQSEEAIKQSEDSYSPGAKGGNDIVSAADHILMTKYDAENTPEALTLRLKLARGAEPGKRRYKINVTSGCVLREWQEHLDG